jgi:hypothetical protein
MATQIRSKNNVLWDRVKHTDMGKENHLLASLPRDVYEKLAPHLQYVSLQQGQSERTKGGGFCPDLILLNQVGRSIQEYTVMGQRICKSAGIGGDTPIVVMAERYGADMEGKDVQVDDAEYVTYLEDGQQLMNLLHRLCPV